MPEDRSETFTDALEEEIELTVSNEDSLIRFTIYRDGAECGVFNLDPEDMGEFAAALFENS